MKTDIEIFESIPKHVMEYRLGRRLTRDYGENSPVSYSDWFASIKSETLREKIYTEMANNAYGIDRHSAKRLTETSFSRALSDAFRFNHSRDGQAFWGKIRNTPYEKLVNGAISPQEKEETRKKREIIENIQDLFWDKEGTEEIVEYLEKKL